MTSIDAGTVPTRPAPESLVPILVWHRRADQYRKALMSRLPGVRIDAHGGEARVSLPSDAEVLLAWQLPPGVLDQMPDLRWIQVTGAGVDGFLRRTDLRPDIELTRSLGRFPDQAAEYVLAYLLHSLVRIEDYRRNQDRGVWKQLARPLLRDQRIGIMGLGAIGGRIAGRLSALGADVVGVCRHGRPIPDVSRVVAFDAWRSILPGCDALVLALPLTDETAGLIDAEALATLPRGATLINVGRGELVSEDALVEVLRTGHVGAAVLDVFAEEPLPGEHPLWTEPSAWITPHIAAPSEIEPIADEFAANYRRFAGGEALANRVDRDRGY